MPAVSKTGEEEAVEAISYLILAGRHISRPFGRLGRNYARYHREVSRYLWLFREFAALAWRLYEAIAVDGNERNGSCSATAGIFQDLFEQSDDGVIGFMEQWP